MRNSLLSFCGVALASLLLLAGCGGGGGGGSISNNLTYTTDWSVRASGNSQRVIVSNTSGVEDSIILNASGGVQTNVFKNLTGGTHTVRAELYAGADASGALVGVATKMISLSGSQSVSTAVSGTPTGVLVTPSSASVATGASQQFAASLVDSTGNLMFSDPTTTTWGTTGSGFTVSSVGNVTGTAIGSGTVRATISALTGSGNVVVTPGTADRTKWTILIFLNASNNLYPYSDLNMNQIEKIAMNPQVRVVVQWKQDQVRYPDASFNGTRRYLAKHDSDTGSIGSTLVQDLGLGVDMGTPETMTNFISWAKAKYPSDHVGLIIWNHGNGWSRNRLVGPTTRGISYDDEFGSVIDTWQLSQALGDNHFDFIGTDACDMQMLEVAYEMKDKADYIIGSEELTPAPGYVYDKALAPLMANADLAPKDAVKGFVDCMITEPSYQSLKITQSVLDTSKLGALKTAVSTLADTLRADPASIATQIQNARISAQRYDTGSIHQYFDLHHVCSKLNVTGVPTSVKTAAAAVQTAVTNAVVWEGHTTHSPNSHGIAIDFSSKSQINLAAYSNLRLATDSNWDEWLSVAP